MKPSVKVCLLQGTKSLCCQSREQCLEVGQDACKQFLHGIADLETLQLYMIHLKQSDELGNYNACQARLVLSEIILVQTQKHVVNNMPYMS